MSHIEGVNSAVKNASFIGLSRPPARRYVGSRYAVPGNHWTDGLVVGAGFGARFAKDLSFSFQFRDVVGLTQGGSQGFSGGVDFGF
jgi:hypothetical protein